eukprot:843079_1
MGCICGNDRTTNDKREPLLETTELDESKLDHPLPQRNTSTEDGIPEMSVNTLANPSARNSTERRHNALSKPSPLTNVTTTQMNFNHMKTTAIPESDEILDASGNVHINRYYNQTRNANLSITSKMDDLSAAPIYPNTNKASLNSGMMHHTQLTSNDSTMGMMDPVEPSLPNNISWNLDDTTSNITDQYSQYDI